MKKTILVWLLLATLFCAGSAAAVTFTGAAIVLDGGGAVINVTSCTWTFTDMLWDSGGDWLYIKDHTVASNPSITTAMTYNYTELSGYYNCDSFPYHEIIGSAPSGGGGGGGGSTSLDVSGTEDDASPSTEEPSSETTDDRTIIEKIADKISEIIGIGGTDDEPGQAVQPTISGPGPVEKAVSWLQGFWEQDAKTYVVWGGIGLAAILALWFFGKTLFGAVKWLFKGVFKMLWFVLAWTFKLAAPLIGLIFGFLLTPIGLVVAVIGLGIAYVAWKVFIG